MRQNGHTMSAYAKQCTEIASEARAIAQESLHLWKSQAEAWTQSTSLRIICTAMMAMVGLSLIASSLMQATLGLAMLLQKQIPASSTSLLETSPIVDVFIISSSILGLLGTGLTLGSFWIWQLFRFRNPTAHVDTTKPGKDNTPWQLPTSNPDIERSQTPSASPK